MKTFLLIRTYELIWNLSNLVIVPKHNRESLPVDSEIHAFICSYSYYGLSSHPLPCARPWHYSGDERLREDILNSVPQHEYMWDHTHATPRCCHSHHCHTYSFIHSWSKYYEPGTTVGTRDTTANKPMSLPAGSLRSWGRVDRQ